MDNNPIDDLDAFYKEYGELLARRLPEIAHSSAKPTFVFVSDIDDPVEVKSFVNDKILSPQGPLLIWDNFDEDIDTGGRDNYHLALKCSLSILQNASSDKADQASAYATCRKIILRAISVMIADSENGVLDQNGVVLEIRQLPLEKIGPISTTWYGYGAQFSWLVPIDLTLDEDELLAD